jgi:head-tail adaptor
MQAAQVGAEGKKITIKIWIKFKLFNAITNPII